MTTQKFYKTLFFLLGVFFLWSCSRKSDKFINRNWHALTTKYNTLYNGGVAYDNGRKSLIDNYTDNYWKQLPVERLELRDEILLATEATNPNFSKAEEKAIKAIQRHSMEIDGIERNYQTDEAFMLLGKARYFDQRFMGALEAFNYVLYKYPTSNSINKARVWRAKTQIRLGNDKGAIKALRKVLFEDAISMKPEELSDANIMLAQAYINLKQKDSAISPIKTAIQTTKDNEKKGRYHYILGQLYNKIRERDSANMQFDAIIKLNRRIPRAYLINAYLAKARNLEIESEDQIAFLDILNELESNWENRPFLDKIYYEKAIFFFGIDSINQAEYYYKKSLDTKTSDTYLHSLNYETLSRICFNDQRYELSGKYMDSTLSLLDENSKRYRVINKKRKYLEDIIHNQYKIQFSDSILKLAKLSKQDQTAFFLKYTDSLKKIKQKEIKRQRNIKANDILTQNSVGNNGKLITTTPPTTTSKEASAQQFYFYNPTQVEKGRYQFQAIFGDRQLVDNWKIASINSFESVQESVEIIEEDYDVEKDPTFKVSDYISKIPNDPKVIDSLKIILNKARFDLGNIFKEQLKEYDIAAEQFEKLLKNTPETSLILPSKYNLFKIYQAIGNFEKEAFWKADIIKNYPNSRYAAIASGNQKLIKKVTDNTDQSYTTIYKKYQNQDYTSALALINTEIDKYAAEPIVAKYLLLKALIICKLEGVSMAKPLLENLVLTHPKSEAAKKAKTLLEKTITPIDALSWGLDSLSQKTNYKLVTAFRNAERSKAASLLFQVDTLVKNRKYFQLKTSLDFYSKDSLFLTIHGLRSLSEAKALKGISYSVNVKNTGSSWVEISSENYIKVLAHKNFKTYFKKKDSLLISQ